MCKNINSLRKLAKQANKELVYNRSLAGYQIKASGFQFSEIEYPGVDENKKLYLDDLSFKKLKQCI